MKRLINFILITFFIFLVVSLCIWDRTGDGMKIVMSSDTDSGMTVFINYPFYAGSVNLSLEDGIMVSEGHYVASYNVSHRDSDAYWTLSDNEKIEYNSIISRAEEIWNGKSNLLNIEVSLRDFTVDTIDSITDAYFDAIGDVDHQEVFNAVHEDWNWLLPWELDMDWTVETSEETLYKNGTASEGYYTVVMNSSSCIDNTTEEVSEIYSYTSETDDTVNEILKGEPSSEADKVRYFAEAVDEYASYDDELAKKLKNNTENRDLYKKGRSVLSVFSESIRSPVICVGYANAFQLLCDRGDVECYTVSGNVNYDGTVSLHTWNVVVIDEIRYLVDTTNSDDGCIGADGKELILYPIYDSHSYSVTINNSVISYIEESK